MAENLPIANPSDVWIPAPAECYQTLQTATLDLWRIALDQSPRIDLLSEDEITRMKRYRFDADQRKFAVARSSLRQILGRYTQQDAAALVFTYGVYGKPYLSHTSALSFNLSHSGEYALCGVARQELGVDIEQLRLMDRLDGLIQRCLAPSEQTAIAQVSPAQQSEAFLRYWTCKEAYLKATGQGISESLSAIAVDLTPPPQLHVPAPSWQLKLLTPCQGYTAAAVMAPSITKIRLWNF